MQTRILRLPQVKAMVGLAGSTIYLKVKQGTFPRQISLGPRSSGWMEAEVRQWIEERVKLSRPETAK